MVLGSSTLDWSILIIPQRGLMQYTRTVTRLRSQLKYTTRLELMILHQHISYTECPHLGYTEMEGSEQVFQLEGYK
ncbi:hypothetical protein SO802_031504 [Lithocarpus litseifolius]|uniref:Uncharacterized protein n=1 Tax=Lithocarpus litseifolius TaxID=425828 RepID=A0AAW2BMF1_9ROSI